MITADIQTQDKVNVKHLETETEEILPEGIEETGEKDHITKIIGIGKDGKSILDILKVKHLKKTHKKHRYITVQLDTDFSDSESDYSQYDPTAFQNSYDRFLSSLRVEQLTSQCDDLIIVSLLAERSLPVIAAIATYCRENTLHLAVYGIVASTLSATDAYWIKMTEDCLADRRDFFIGSTESGKSIAQLHEEIADKIYTDIINQDLLYMLEAISDDNYESDYLNSETLSSLQELLTDEEELQENAENAVTDEVSEEDEEDNDNSMQITW
ncbi:MAG: hypothetical protein IJG49_02615 [Erysipelotrichaceae bacterium]|nr:hypothetical protein [Erysipelotrichaceae bacterium]